MGQCQSCQPNQSTHEICKQTNMTTKANRFSNIFIPSEIPDDISSIRKTKTGGGGGGGSVGSSAPILRTLKMSNHGTGNDMISNSNGIGTSFALIFTENNNNNILETAVDTHRKTEKDGDMHSQSGTQRRNTQTYFCSIENDVESNNNKLFNNAIIEINQSKSDFQLLMELEKDSYLKHKPLQDVHNVAILDFHLANTHSMATNTLSVVDAQPFIHSHNSSHASFSNILKDINNNN